MQLGDYLGGSDPTTLTSSAYKSAVTFWEGLDLHEAGDPTDKPTLVICGLLRRHRQLITCLPLAVELIPDPAERRCMSKRCWEACLHRACTFLDLLADERDRILFMYLHALASEKLQEQRCSSLKDLPDPNEFQGDLETWRRDACRCAVQTQAAVTGCHKQRSQSWQDIEGGSSAKTVVSTSSMSTWKPEQWLRLSRSRAEALQKRRRTCAENNEECTSTFAVLWQASMSPVCCPSYGVSTSQIRIPLPLVELEGLPILQSTPSKFEGLIPPKITCSLLRDAHPHPRDQQIEFVEATHTYFVRGERVPLSVTGLVHSFAQSFDADQVIPKMMAGFNWPRTQYMVDVDGQSRPMTPNEIKESWRKNAAEAAGLGTWMHLQIEVLLNGGGVPAITMELQLFSEFLRTSQQLLAFRTEWCIFGEDERLAGCIDFVALHASGEVVLFGWKRTKELSCKYCNKWARMKPPLSHVEDCAGLHYRLQLNLYKFLLQKYYGLRVRGMFIVGLHPDNFAAGPFLDEVPDMQQDIDAMLQVHRARLVASQPQAGHEGLEVFGGAVTRTELPIEVLESMPTHFFSWGYLAALAAVSKSMLSIVRRFQDWGGRDVAINNSEFGYRRRVLSTHRFWENVRRLAVDMPQLAMFLDVPEQARLVWSIAAIPRPPTSTGYAVGLASTQPLMGFACFELGISRDISRLKVSVQDLQGTSTSFFQVENPGTPDVHWVLGLNDAPPLPIPAAVTHAIRPHEPIFFKLEWSERKFQLEMNANKVFAARLRAPFQVSAPPLSKLSVWVYSSTRQLVDDDFQINAAPSPVLRDAQIRCSVCHEVRSLLLPLWSVCPCCHNWACAHHVGSTPWRSCPGCTSPLADYMGGSPMECPAWSVMDLRGGASQCSMAFPCTACERLHISVAFLAKACELSSFTCSFHLYLFPPRPTSGRLKSCLPGRSRPNPRVWAVFNTLSYLVSHPIFSFCAIQRMHRAGLRSSTGFNPEVIENTQPETVYILTPCLALVPRYKIRPCMLALSIPRRNVEGVSLGKQRRVIPLMCVALTHVRGCTWQERRYSVAFVLTAPTASGGNFEVAEG